MRPSCYLTRLWFTLCVIGNVFQVYNLCNSYFKYSVTTEVRIESEEYSALANLALCFDLMEVVNWSAIATHDADRFRTLLRFLELRDDEDHLNGTRVSQQFLDSIVKRTVQVDVPVKIHMAYALMDQMAVDDIFKCTLSQESIISGILSGYDPSKPAAYLTIREMSHIIKIRRYLRTFQMCFVLELTPFSVPTTLQLRDFIFSGMLYYLTFVPDLSTRLATVTVFFTRGDRPRHGFDRSIRLSLSSGVFIMSQQEIIHHLLEAPYETNCRKYTITRNGRIENSSKSQCHEMCVFRLSHKIYGAVYPAIAVARRAGTIKMIAPVTPTGQMQVNSSLVETRCRAMCSQRDCDSTVYVPLLSSYLDGQIGLMNYLPSSPPIHIRVNAAISWSIFATNVCSTLSFWFAFSLVDLTHILRFMQFGRANRSFFSHSRDQSAKQSVSGKRRRDRHRREREASIDQQLSWYMTPTKHHSGRLPFPARYMR